MDTDIDSSDMLSFKGIVHFVFGFSLTLTTMGGVSVLSTFVAVLVGLLFTVILFYLYRYILLAETPKEAKTLGREVRNFDEKSWNEVKIQKMYLALEGKFSQNKDLMDKLKDPALNGKFFVEASPFDRVWGIGYDQDHALQNQSNWGENLLGKTLTFYRGSL